jgi:hypothetical protein
MPAAESPAVEKCRAVKGHLYYGFFHMRLLAVFADWLAAVHLQKRCFFSGLIQLFIAQETLTAVAHDEVITDRASVFITDSDGFN